uniref:Uncharacterized protein n=1 Tax=Tanacetum cinerariifolium TaxID=118510 RepID=A0A699T754_TANCI|nr:hypothetical protein [Tanacetum cinerariifolium]
MVCRPCKLPCGELHHKGYDITAEEKFSRTLDTSFGTILTYLEPVLIRLFDVVWRAKKLLTSSMVVIVDPPGAIMEPTTQRRKFLIQVSTSLQFIKMLLSS